MRIAYIANYQGPTLLAARPCLYNLSLAARVKIQLVAELLRGSGHEVEVISQGAVESEGAARRRYFRYYPALKERTPFSAGISVHYTSAIKVRFLTGWWESWQARRHLRARHRCRPFDAVIIYNLQSAQVGCAAYARNRLRLPVILQYEDDGFVTVHGHTRSGLTARRERHLRARALAGISAGTGVSPYLLAQMPPDIPKLLLRGIVSQEIAALPAAPKQNWVVFAGTHESTQGLVQLLDAWRTAALPGWQLHIAGHGPLTPTLNRAAADQPSIVMHGLLDRSAYARLLAGARIGMNPQDPTVTAGNVFPFKVVEYLAAGAHVISTPRGALEPELEAGLTYINGNSAGEIAAALRRVVAERRYEQTAAAAALDTYGPVPVAQAINRILRAVVTGAGREHPARADETVAAETT